MISESLFLIESGLRRAVETSSYADVERLVVEYCQTAAAEIRALPEAGLGRGEIIARVNQTLDWGRSMLYASRAAHVEGLRTIPGLRSYLQENVQRSRSAGFDV
jgi:hypothetical protein